LIAGLYAIADSGSTPTANLPGFVRSVLEGGCRLVQLRMKGTPATDDIFLATARAILELKQQWAFTFIVNDHADVALEIGADGVHVGAGDESVASIRKRAGRRLVIGYSSHAVDEAIAAAADGADYVAFGAIYPTATKGPGHPVQGLARLTEVVRQVSAPVVAIGGIGRAHVQPVLATGASAIAMINALARAPDVVSETRWFVETMHNAARNA